MAAVNITSTLSRNIFKHSALFTRNSGLGWMYRSRAMLGGTAGTETNENNKTPDNNIDTMSPAEKELTEQLAALTKEKESLVEKVADFQDKYQRTLADRENVRMRLEKQITDAKQFGIQGFCKDLLEVSDVFRRAIQSVPEEKIHAQGELKTLYEGLLMTETHLHSVFRRHGLEPVEPQVGDKFDPSLQEAMFELPIPNLTAGTIAEVIRNGWTLHHRCIRSAQVGVVKG